MMPPHQRTQSVSADSWASVKSQQSLFMIRSCLIFVWLGWGKGGGYGKGGGGAYIPIFKRIVSLALLNTDHLVPDMNQDYLQRAVFCCNCDWCMRYRPRSARCSSLISLQSLRRTTGSILAGMFCGCAVAAHEMSDTMLQSCIGCVVVCCSNQ